MMSANALAFACEADRLSVVKYMLGDHPSSCPTSRVKRCKTSRHLTSLLLQS